MHGTGTTVPEGVDGAVKCQELQTSQQNETRRRASRKYAMELPRGSCSAGLTWPYRKEKPSKFIGVSKTKKLQTHNQYR